MAESDSFCPYRGLEPYTENDRDYFFGRTDEQESLAATAATARLTVLFGVSGVGKSSLLLAGVVPFLAGLPAFKVVVFRDWHGQDFSAVLKREVASAAGAAIDTAQPLSAVLKDAATATGATFILVLDQFEAYSLYHPVRETGETFDAELARAVNGRDVNAHFLFSIREDALADFDRYQGRIPNLLGNYYRLEHLGRKGAQEAIRLPLERYNQVFQPQPPVSIDPALENTLLQLTPGRFRFGKGELEPVPGVSPSSAAEERIEAPFLQLVLTKIWEVERKNGSAQLRQQTLDAFGGVETIVRQHLDDKLKDLSPEGREVCVRVFDRLVTPSGAKIALMERDFDKYAGPYAAYVEPVLQKLETARILRPVTIAQGRTWEVYHDVLGAAVQDWASRYQQENAERLAREEAQNAQQQARLEAARARRFMWLGIALAVLLVFAIGALVWGYSQNQKAKREQANAEHAKTDAESARNAAVKAQGAAELATAAATETSSKLKTSNQQLIQKTEALKVATDTAQKNADQAQAALDREKQAESLAEAQRLFANAQKLKASDTRLATALAYYAYSNARSAKADAVANDADTLMLELTAQNQSFGDHGKLKASAISADGQKIVTVNEDGLVRLWSPNGNLLQKYVGLKEIPNAVRLSPDGSSLLAATTSMAPVMSSGAARINIYSLDGKGGLLPPPYKTLSFDAPRFFVDAALKRVLSLQTGGVLVSSGLDKDSGDVKYPVSQPATFALSPDGQWVAAASYSDLQVWAAGTGQPMDRKALEARVRQPRDLTFTPDSKALAVSGSDAAGKMSLNLYTISSGKLTGPVSYPICNFYNHAIFLTQSLLIVSCQPSGLEEVPGPNGIKIWDLGKNSAILPIDSNSLPTDVAPAAGLMLLPSYYDTVSLRETNTNNEIHQIPPRNDIVRAVLSAGGSKVVTALRSGALDLWNIGVQSDPRSLPPFEGLLYDLRANADGTRILALDSKGLHLILSSSASSSPASTIVSDRVNSFSLDASGRTILLRALSNELDVLDLSGNQAQRRKLLSLDNARFESAILRPDGKEAAVIENNTLRFIDTATGTVLRTPKQLKAIKEGLYPRSLMYSARGDVLIIYDRDTGLTPLDALTGEPLPIPALPFRSDWDLTRYSAPSPDGQSIAVQVFQGPKQETWLWNFRSGTTQKIRTVDFAAGYGIGFSNDGSRLFLLDQLPYSSSFGFTLTSFVVSQKDRLSLAKRAAASMTQVECKDQFGKPECPLTAGQ